MRTKSSLQAEKILVAAARLFATQRFHEVRMEDLAAAAEVGKGTLYRYFKDKEELYLALLDRAAAGLAARLQEETEDARGPRGRLENVVAAILGFFDENPYLFDLIQHAEAMQRADGEIPWGQTRRDTFDLIRRIFEEGRRDGSFHINDFDVGVLMLLGGLRAIIRFGARPRDRGLPAQIVEQFLHGAAIRPRVPEPSRT